jgi:hypothetical protein
VSVYFHRRKKGAWWLLIAVAFMLPLLESVVGNFIRGLPPLPYGTAYPDHVTPVPPGDTGNITTFTGVTIYWDTLTPMLAVAFGWAYFADRKKLVGGPTAQT